MKKFFLIIIFTGIFFLSIFSANGTDNILSAKNAKNIVLLEKLGGHSGKLWRVAFSVNGLLATSDTNGKAIVWKLTDDTVTFEKYHDFKMFGTVEAVDFIDEEVLITLSNDYRISYWDLKTGELIKEERRDYGYIGYVLVSEDNQLLAVESKGRFDIFNIETGEKLYHFTTPNGTCFEYRFTSDNKKMVTSSHEGSVILWDLETGKKIREYEGHKWDVHALDISSDDKYIVTASTDSKVKIWDLESGKCLHTMYHYDGLYDVAFSPDGCLIASVGCDRVVLVWESTSGRRLKALRHDDEIHAVDFSADGKYIVAGGYDSDIYIWGIR